MAFGENCKKQGIACHHPKLFVLQREDSIRVIVTSANLGAKQVITWFNVLLYMLYYMPIITILTLT